MNTELNNLVNSLLPALRRYTWKIINSKELINVEADEIINTAYIILWENNLEFSFDNMKDPIKKTINNFKFNRVPVNIVIVNQCTDKVCKKCKLPFPLGMFHKNRIDHRGVIIYQPNCKTCQKENDDINRAKRLANPEVKKVFVERRKELGRKKAKVIQGNEKLLTHFRGLNKEYSKTYREKLKCA